MKILLVIPSLTQGGAEKNFIWLANKLSKKFDVVFVTLTKKTKLQSENLENKISFYELESNKSFESIFKLRKIIKKEIPTLVISTIISAHFLSIISTIRFGKKPKHIFRLSNNIDYIKSSSLKNRLMLVIACRFANKIVVLSDENFETARNKSFISEDQLIKIENPIMANHILDHKLKTNNILCISRIEPHKNLNFLIDNLELLNEEYSFKLDIFGNGSCLNEYRTKYSRSNFLSFKGFLDNKEINYNNYGIHINCSEYEGSPNATIEAIINGLVCLVSDNLVQTLPTILQSKIQSYKKGDSEDFIEKMKSIFEIKDVSRQNIETNEDGIVNLWKELIFSVAE